MGGAQTGATRSEQLYVEASRSLVGGMSAAARLNPALGRPFFAARGEGARLWDVDGREYIDLHTSFGAALLGYRHPAIEAAVREATRHRHPLRVRDGAPGPGPRSQDHRDGALRRAVRFTNSGTETTWHAVRTARVFTGRQLVKFEGHFHGFSDVLGYSSWPAAAVTAGPVDAPARIPESAGHAAGRRGTT